VGLRKQNFVRRKRERRHFKGDLGIAVVVTLNCGAVVVVCGRDLSFAVGLVWTLMNFWSSWLAVTVCSKTQSDPFLRLHIAKKRSLFVQYRTKSVSHVWAHVLNCLQHWETERL
jgi:hypothetical protein